MTESEIKVLQANSPSISIEDLAVLGERASMIVEKARGSMLAPESRKIPPTFNSSQLAELTGVTRANIPYRAKRDDLPNGESDGNRKEWSLVEARQWIKHCRPDFQRDPEISNGVVITVANFKGGVTKTTTAATLAQGLSLRGLEVLIIDADPQGSLTTLYGVLPDSEVDDEATILPLITGELKSILPSVRSTYWDGIDMVAAAPSLYNAEFHLPARQMKEGSEGFEFWRVLDDGLEEARKKYDVIIIDTPPSLSYITINALVAAQGIVMPLPPSTLDFASSAQFWNLFSDLVKKVYQNSKRPPKVYSFVNILLSRVDSSEKISFAVKDWIVAAYGTKVLPIEIPKTSIAATASAVFGTVYDLDATSARSETLKKAKDRYDQLVDYTSRQLQAIWVAEESKSKGSE